MATTKDLTSTLQDVRKMRRSIRLRGEQDPEKVAQSLTVILREAIALRAANSGRVGRSAVNELRNIRRAMLTNQISAGGRTPEFVAKYSAILDQITDTQTDSARETEGVGGGIGQAITQNLPSADAITSALITANPVLGYTTKIARDLFRGRGERKRAQENFEKQRLEGLKRQEQETVERLNQMVDGVEDSVSGDMTVQPQDVGYAQSALVEKLDLIRDEIHKLNEVLQARTRAEEQSQLERVETNNQMLEHTEANTETNEGVKNTLERIESIDADRARRERDQSGRNRLLERERQYESGVAASGTVESPAQDESKLKEMFSGLGDGNFFAAGAGGAFGALATKVLAPFVGLFNFLTKGASILGRLGRFTGVVTAIMAIYDFFDGFMNAADILGMEESEVKLMDRIKVGFASIVAGLAQPIDWILDFFGMGFMDDKQDFTKKVLGAMDTLVEFFSSPGKFIHDFIKDNDFIQKHWETVKQYLDIDTIIGFITKPFRVAKEYMEGLNVGERLKSLGQSVMTFGANAISNVSDAMEVGKKQIQSFKGMIGSLFGSSVDTLMSTMGTAKEAIGSLNVSERLERFKGRFDRAFGSLLERGGEVFDDVKGYVSNFDTSSVFKDIVEGVGDVFDSIRETFVEITSAIEEWFSNKIKSLKESWLGETASGIIEFFGGDEAKPDEAKVSSVEVENKPKGMIVEADPASSQLMSDVLATAAQNANSARGGSQGNLMIAPQSSTNVNARIFQGSTGARNNDTSWTRNNALNLLPTR